MSYLQELISELHTLEQELSRFENKYGFLSETFFAWYQDGHEPENPDWVQDFVFWAGTYQLKMRRRQKYNRLVSQAVSQHGMSELLRKPSLAGIAR